LGIFLALEILPRRTRLIALPSCARDDNDRDPAQTDAYNDRPDH
jgi:hypothetical protein